MRILVISPLPPPVGGIATWTRSVLAASTTDGSVVMDLIDSAVKWRRISDSSLAKRLVLGSVQAVVMVWRVLRALLIRRPSVVHVCTAGEIGLIRDCIVLALCRVFCIPALVHFHRGKEPEFRELMGHRGLEPTLVKLACILSSRVIVLNRASLIALSPWAGDKCAVVENMIDCSSVIEAHTPALALHDKAISILFVGYAVERKGVVDLFAVFSRLQSANPHVRLVVAGPCEEQMRARLLQMVQDPSAVRFAGSLSIGGVYVELANADILCLPSYSEGLPYVILEAMAFGKAIVSTTVGGIPEALADGAGICVSPGDREALEESLDRLVGRADLRQVLGMAAAARCRRVYDSGVVLNKLKEQWGFLAYGS